MALSRSRKRWIIILGFIFIVFITLGIFANLILSNKAEGIIREQLDKAAIRDQQIDFESVRVNIFRRSVSITDISVLPDTAALENVRRSQLSKPLVGLKLEKIRISGIGIMKAIRGEGIAFDRIVLDEPQVVIYGNGSPFKGKDNNDEGSNISSPDSLADSPVREARLRSFQLSDASLRYIDVAVGQTLIDVSGINISMEDIDLHLPGGDSLSDKLKLGDISMRLDSAMLKLPGGFYTLKTGELDISYSQGTMSLDSLELIPAYPKGVFGKRFGKQTDRFDVSAGNISIDGLLFDSLLNNKFIAKEIRLTAPNADICRDKRVERDMSIFPKLFQTSLAGLPVKVFIPSIIVTDALVNYQEIAEGSDTPGGVIISDLEMYISGACNYPDSMENGQALLIDAKGQLMGKSAMQVYFTLPIGNHAEYFTFHGSTAAFPATNLNPLLAPLAFIEATNGTITSTRFYAMAMKDTTVGRIEFMYTDFEVAILKKKKGNEETIQENKFVTFIARTAMHKNNPHSGKPVRIAKMSFIRDRNKGFFNYVWKTIQDGIITTLTPGKKNLAFDLDWNEFSTDWRKVLLDDWNGLQAQNRN